MLSYLLWWLLLYRSSLLASLRSSTPFTLINSISICMTPGYPDFYLLLPLLTTAFMSPFLVTRSQVKLKLKTVLNNSHPCSHPCSHCSLPLSVIPLSPETFKASRTSIVFNSYSLHLLLLHPVCFYIPQDFPISLKSTSLCLCLRS